MSRILDALAHADEKRRQNAYSGGSMSTEDLELAVAATALWGGMDGHGCRLGAAASQRRFSERKSLHYCYSAGIALALGTGMILGRYLESEEIPRRLRQEQATVVAASGPEVLYPALPVKGHLPSCIPWESEDLGYSTSHPGWHRYPAGPLEFRVFREGNSVKAVQALALQKEPLPDNTLAAIAGEGAGKTTYKIASLEKNRWLSD